MIGILLRFVRWLRRRSGQPLLIYVAGPLTVGDMEANVKAAIDAGDALLNAGHAPFIPHLSYYWEARHPHHYERWMWLDFCWLAVCDVLVRIPGNSPGADREVKRANELGIPVYYGVDAFLHGRRETA